MIKYVAILVVVLSGCSSILTVDDYDRGDQSKVAFLHDSAECQDLSDAYRKRTGWGNSYMALCMESRGYKLKTREDR